MIEQACIYFQSFSNKNLEKLSELYAEDGDLVCEQWNAENLKLMEDDVMNQIQAVDS